MKFILTTLTLLAMAASLHAAPDGAQKGEGKPPRGEGKPPRGEGGPGRGDPAAAFAKMDTNGDGKISKEEYLATPMAKENPERAAEGFARRDKNNDGFLTKDEMGPPAGGRPGAEGRPGRPGGEGRPGAEGGKGRPPGAEGRPARPPGGGGENRRPPGNTRPE